MCGRRRQRVITLLLGGLLAVPACANDEIAVIVAQDAPAAAIETVALRNIYLKKLFVDGRGQEFIPLNLPPDHPLRVAFSQALFNKSAQSMQDYWNQRYFQGIAPPYVLSSQTAVLQFVAKTPGAIGYVATCRLTPHVKALLYLSAPAAAREAITASCASPSRESGASE